METQRTNVSWTIKRLEEIVKLPLFFLVLVGLQLKREKQSLKSLDSLCVFSQSLL